MAQADLNSTIAALQGGLTALPPEAAVDNIESWQKQLQGTEAATLLGELKAALTGKGSGKSVGTLLNELGAQATSAAGSVSGDAAKKLEELGQMLVQAGSSLS
jgi:hypothetical protein